MQSRAYFRVNDGALAAVWTATLCDSVEEGTIRVFGIAG